MDRINSIGTTTVGGIRQWQNKNLLADILGTQTNATYENDFQEEFVHGLIEAAGLTPTAGVQTQIRQALKRIFSGNRTAITASATLTADNAGLVVVNAASGNVVLTLPLNSAANGTPLEYIFIRTDTSTNTVTVQDAGSDTDAPGAATSKLVQISGPLWLAGDGVNTWDVVTTGSSGSLLNIQIFKTPGVFTYTPTPGTNWIEVLVVGAGAASCGSSATGTGQTAVGAGGGSGAWAIYEQTGGITSQTVTVGAGGTVSLGGAGGNGGASSFGALVSANGGTGGQGSGATTANAYTIQGGAGATVGSSGVRQAAGNRGGAAQVINLTGIIQNGTLGPVPDAGGGGAITLNAANSAASYGIAGQNGIVVVRERK